MRIIPRIRQLRQEGKSLSVTRKIIQEEFGVTYEFSTISTYAQCDMDLDKDNKICKKWSDDLNNSKIEVSSDELMLDVMYDKARVRGILL
jgi:intein-encoded DNA endonuclease-like protein